MGIHQYPPNAGRVPVAWERTCNNLSRSLGSSPLQAFMEATRISNPFKNLPNVLYWRATLPPSTVLLFYTASTAFFAPQDALLWIDTNHTLGIS